MRDPMIGDRIVAKAKRGRPAIHGTVTRLIFMEHTRPKKMADGPKDGHPDIEVRPDTHDDVVSGLRQKQWKLFPRNYVSGLRFYAKDLELESVMDRLAREA
jgi:hypothetical protein